MFVQTAIAPAPIPASGTGVTPVIPTNGLSRGSVGVTSDHAGVLSVQRYVDAAGITALQPALTANVTGGTPASVGWADGYPVGSIIVSFINNAGAVANLTNLAVNLGP